MVWVIIFYRYYWIDYFKCMLKEGYKTDADNLVFE